MGRVAEIHPQLSLRKTHSIHLAAKTGRDDVIRYYINYGPSSVFSFRDQTDNTALWYALTAKDTTIFDLLAGQLSSTMGESTPKAYAIFGASEANRPDIIDTGSTFDGYFCDFDRNFFFGSQVLEPLAKAYDVLLLK